MATYRAMENFKKAQAMSEGIIEYERAQYRKAFLEGTDEAWKKYRANLKRKINKIYKETGYMISLDRLMNA